MAKLTQILPAHAVTSGPLHHFFGYYDKMQWDATGRYLLGLEVPFADRSPNPDDKATIGIIDLQANNRFEPLAETTAWNWQQGTMLQWLGSAPDRLIIYNDRIGDQYVAVIRDVHSGETTTLPRAVYAVSRDGTQGVCPNFSRIHRTRPGYGYNGVPDAWEDDPAPNDDGIYWMDLTTGENKFIVSLGEIAAQFSEPRPGDGAHWFNHLLFNDDGSRFIFLHRWQRAEGWGQQMITARLDGSDRYLLIDEGVSHFDWRDSRHVIAWAWPEPTGPHYYLYMDQTDEVEIIGEDVLTENGHCTYSPDDKWILTDTYPADEHYQTLILYRPEDGLRVDIGRFFAPEDFKGEMRCDLHPRWNRDGTQVCFDSTQDGRRQMYIVDVSEVVNAY